MGRLTGSCAWENSTPELSLMRIKPTQRERISNAVLCSAVCFFALLSPIQCNYFDCVCTVQCRRLQCSAILVQCSSNEKKARQCITLPMQLLQSSLRASGGRKSTFTPEPQSQCTAGLHCCSGSQLIGACKWCRDWCTGAPLTGALVLHHHPPVASNALHHLLQPRSA